MYFLAPTAAQLGVTVANTSVTLNLKIKTTRLSSELANNYIVNSRPLVLEFNVTNGDSAAIVGLAIIAALDGWISKFGYAEGGLPFTYSNNSGTITMVMKENYTFFQSAITFKVNNLSTFYTVTGLKYAAIAGVATVGGNNATISTGSAAGIRAGDTIAIGLTPVDINVDLVQVVSVAAAGTSFVVDRAINWVANDPIFLLTSPTDPYISGKYLEENSRMSLDTTDGAYTIANGERPVVGGNYSTISFEINDTNGSISGASSYAKHAFLGTTRGEVGGLRKFKFTFYILEGSDALGATGFANDLGDWLDASALTSTGAITDTCKFYVATSALVATGDLWRA